MPCFCAGRLEWGGGGWMSQRRRVCWYFFLSISLERLLEMQGRCYDSLQDRDDNLVIIGGFCSTQVMRAYELLQLRHMHHNTGHNDTCFDRQLSPSCLRVSSLEQGLSTTDKAEVYSEYSVFEISRDFCCRDLLFYFYFSQDISLSLCSFYC